MAKSNRAPVRQSRPAAKSRPTTKSGPAKSNSAQSNSAAKSRPTAKSGPAKKQVPTKWRRRHPVAAALVPVVVVVAAIATMVVIKATGGPATASSSSGGATSAAPTSSASNGTTTLDPSTLAAVTSVSPMVLNTVGSPSGIVVPSTVNGHVALLRSSDGKPDITYIGSEYCPFCAAQRWAMVVALSRFGTFSGLRATHSSSIDQYPNTQTLSFYGSTYTSAYIDFSPVEEQTNQVEGNTYSPLQQPTAAQSALLATYDKAPYTNEAGNIPFVDIANRSIIVGASYSPGLLAGLSAQQIAADLSDPSSPVGQAIDGTANQITASICAVSGNQPTSVCNSSAIAAIRSKGA